MPTYTVRQREVLLFIKSTLEERGVAPTLEEIGESLGGITRVAVFDHLRALERKGAIKRRSREARAIEVLDREYAPVRGIPLAGTIAAGEPIMEIEDREEVRLQEILGATEGTFLLRVRGDSMIEDHICDGDLVLVESVRMARNGETVVAVVNGDVTLKRLYRERDRVRLQPANPRLKARSYPAKSVKIRGVVRGVIRRT